MIRMILAAAAALALVSAAPAFACPDCKDCPHHKVAAAETGDKAAPADPKAGDKKVAGCACVKGDGKCKCGDKCACANCPVHGKKTEKADKKA